MATNRKYRKMGKETEKRVQGLMDIVSEGIKNFSIGVLNNRDVQSFVENKVSHVNYKICLFPFTPV